MRTLLFIVGGLFLYFLLLLTTQRSDRAALRRTSLLFIGIWFLVAVGNLVFGISSTGGSVADQVPIAALIFAVPAAPAGRRPPDDRNLRANSVAVGRW